MRMQQEYSILEQMFDQSRVTHNLVYNKIFNYRNRYSDILTYHKSRVTLQRGVQDSEFPEADYINACFVNSPFQLSINGQVFGDRKIIASQGPLPSTCHHFWQMIIE
jgi:protein tyrosine phosphatase